MYMHARTRAHTHTWAWSSIPNQCVYKYSSLWDPVSEGIETQVLCLFQPTRDFMIITQPISNCAEGEILKGKD